jgi:hypothetical protein
MDDRDLYSNFDLLAAITKGLNLSIYRVDTETVSGSDAKEMATVRNNFLIRKLGMADSKEQDAGALEVMERIGKTEKKIQSSSLLPSSWEVWERVDLRNVKFIF